MNPNKVNRENMIRIFAISGSLRAGSSNTLLIQRFAEVESIECEVDVYDHQAELPHFNPDLESRAGSIVSDLWARVRAADAIVVSTPEYAHGLPGSLKNVFDWLVGSDAFIDKPFAVLTACPRSTHARESLLEILRTMSGIHVTGADLTFDMKRGKLDGDTLLAESANVYRIQECKRTLVQFCLGATKSRGVSMVELMVVLAIISIMLGLLLPAVHTVRERARETVCKNNLYQLNLALAHFAESQKRLPKPALPGRVSGWTIEVLPYIEQRNLKEAVPGGLPIANVTPQFFRPPAIFRCPRRTVLDDTSDDRLWPGHYVFIPGPGRESFALSDSPVDFVVPWLNGPEMSYASLRTSLGPHSGGFHTSNGFQQGVGFVPQGE